ncbi:MAG: Stp1/IreP family PP2C-type Ser/Thr phosphatase [Lachnospiraceae bacterium]|nr:Stp1/IreP family PP2C-type Ser/Thr phosphatase [Lachnospiraceae bacterium]
MRVKSYSVTDIGRQRQLNQDYVFTSEVPMGPLSNLFVVADGMGGHKAGEYASKCAVETIVEDINTYQDTGIIKSLTMAIQHANAKIRQVANSDINYQGMGTTLVTATYSDDTLYVGNVGDSRLYVIGDGIRQITTDHSLVEEMIRMGGLDREKARTHPDKNIITRAIGVVEVVDVDFFEVEDLKEGDIILMCSDGLSNMLTDHEIAEIVNARGTLEEKADKLVAAANQNGGKDNIAVILIEMLPDEVIHD